MTQLPLDPRDPDDMAAELITGALDRTLFVEAGAGTGKTWALVQRVVSLVIEGTMIERIVAITFTEKAAAELKDRIRTGLEARLGETLERDEVVTRALGSLDRAPISTIHSFCQNLLHSFAAEAGIDPSFEVQDEVAAERRLQDRWRGYVEGLSGDAGAVAALDRALGLGLTTGELEKLAKGLTERAELVSLLEDKLPPAAAPDWSLLPRYTTLLEGIVPPSVPQADELRLRAESLAALVAELRRDTDDREVVLASAAGELGRSFKKCGNGATWGSALADVRDACTEVSEGLKGILAGSRAEALRQVMPSIVKFVDDDARLRGREGLVTFDDLILRVRDLLAANDQAVLSLRDRYDALLIDEFQDTDPLQVEIAIAFATDPVSGKIEPGRLFLVGDPKQSIYRFRRADMAIYSRTRIAIESADGRFPLLQRNRRSRPVIIRWVNSVFERLIGAGALPAVQPPYHAIRELREEDELGGPGVACFGREVSDGSNARQVRALESRDVAAHCRAVIEEAWQVWDKETLAARFASFRDIAVLIPSRNVLASLERSLGEARVPYRVEGGSLIYRTQEVRDLINCLTAIDDPADEVAVVAALRSTALACSDVELARFVAGGGRLNYLNRGLEAFEGPVAEGLRTLKRYHEGRHEKSLAALVEEFAAECGQVETGILDQGDRNSFRRVRFIVEQARAFESQGPESLRAMVQWLEGRSGLAMLDNEGAGLDDDEDAVRILTIHGAKGLEFPIVVLAGGGTAPNVRPGSYLVDRSDGRLAICVGSKGNSRRFELGDVEHLEQIEKEHVEAEFLRLLYVAATRARDHLLFSLYRRKGSWRTTAAVQLEAAGASEGIAVLDSPPASERGLREPFEGLAIDTPGVRTPQELAEERQELIETGRTRRYTSATRLGRSEEKPAGEDDTEPWSRGRAGTRLGRAVHAAVQSLPLQPDDVMIEAFSRAQAVAEAIPDRAAEVARLVRAALASGAAARARAAARALREVPFAVAMDGVTVEGFVDLLIETSEGLEIVDWKTDRVSADEVTARLADYRLQAGLYVLGIEAATHARVHRVTYVFVSAGREESPEDPSAMADAARSRLIAGTAPGP